MFKFSSLSEIWKKFILKLNACGLSLKLDQNYDQYHKVKLSYQQNISPP